MYLHWYHSTLRVGAGETIPICRPIPISIDISAFTNTFLILNFIFKGLFIYKSTKIYCKVPYDNERCQVLILMTHGDICI